MTELYLAAAHGALVRYVLASSAPRPCRVWVFGSRADGRAFTESALPWRVDVVDLVAASEAFRTRVGETAQAFLDLA